MSKPSETILEEAQRLVYGPRQQDYGHPMDDFARTAGMWSGLFRDKLKADFTPADVALAMVCVKLSREMTHPKRDNMVDMAGYAATLELVREREAGVEQCLGCGAVGQCPPDCPGS